MDPPLCSDAHACVCMLVLVHIHASFIVLAYCHAMPQFKTDVQIRYIMIMTPLHSTGTTQRRRPIYHLTVGGKPVAACIIVTRWQGLRPHLPFVWRVQARSCTHRFGTSIWDIGYHCNLLWSVAFLTSDRFESSNAWFAQVLIFGLLAPRPSKQWRMLQYFCQHIINYVITLTIQLS